MMGSTNPTSSCITYRLNAYSVKFYVLEAQHLSMLASPAFLYQARNHSSFNTSA